jgi:hypothetical protein
MMEVKAPLDHGKCNQFIMKRRRRRRRRNDCGYEYCALLLTKGIIVLKRIRSRLDKFSRERLYSRLHWNESPSLRRSSLLT